MTTSKPRPSLNVIETSSHSGSPEKENEDSVGFNQSCAFVLDGATTLADIAYMHGFGSDAAWLSKFAKAQLEKKVLPESELAEVTEKLIVQARKAFFSNADETNTHRYAWPSASMAMVHLGLDVISFSGFGDCTLILEDRHGNLSTHSPLSGFSEWETRRAGKHLKRLGGMKTATLLNDETTLNDIRNVRALQNTSQSNIWTLGIVPEAARHMHREVLGIELPARGLLCSDGFYALVANYDAYRDRSLLNTVASKGLDHLQRKLREIETKIDPEAMLYPRFKRSDDSSAIHFELC